MKYSIPICSNCSEADIRDRIKSLSYHPTFIFTKKINRIWLRGIMGILRMRPVFPATLSVKQDGENRITIPSIGQTIAVDVLFGYGVTQNSDILYWNEKYRDEMLDGAVLIGFDVYQGFLFLIADGRDDTGVYYWDDSYVFEESDDDQNVYLLVKDFSELAVSKS